MSFSNRLFPEIGSEIVESLGARSLSDVAETQLFTKFLHILHLKKTNAKYNVLWIHINIPSKTIVLIVMARTFEINFEKAHSMQVYVYMLSEEINIA